MIDLFDIAASNADSINENFDEAIANLSDQKATNAKDFAQWVESKALISINLRLFVITEILNGIPYKNIHEWAQEQASLSGRKKDEILRERLKSFYDKRITFDQAFQEGESFRYGALNAGSLGLSIYSPYCIVLRSSFHDSLAQITCHSGDSLEICFSEVGKFNAAPLTQCVAPFSYRHKLATHRLITEINGSKEDDWQQLLISTDFKQYFEIIFKGDVNLNSLQCVRIDNDEYHKMWGLAFANFGKTLTEPEKALIQDYVQLFRAVKDGKIQLELIK